MWGLLVEWRKGSKEVYLSGPEIMVVIGNRYHFPGNVCPVSVVATGWYKYGNQRTTGNEPCLDGDDQGILIVFDTVEESLAAACGFAIGFATQPYLRNLRMTSSFSWQN